MTTCWHHLALRCRGRSASCVVSRTPQLSHLPKRHVRVPDLLPCRWRENRLLGGITMGCSRPGAVAVVAVIASCFFTTISLVVPYWSKLVLADAITVSDDESAPQTTAELTFGVWGSCLTVMDTTSNTSMIEPITSSAGSISSPGDLTIHKGYELVAASFTCASFFSTKVYSVSCRRSPGKIGGECVRHDIIADANLCDYNGSTIEMLLLVPEHLRHQREQLVGLLEDNSSEAVMAWESFRSDACSSTGALARANAVLAVTAISLQGAALVVLLFAITFAPVESLWVQLGRALTVFAIALQLTLLALWTIESQLMAKHSMTFATSFYLALLSIGFLLLGSFLTRNHLWLVQNARRKIEEEFELIGGDEVMQVEKTNPSDALEIRIESKLREVEEVSTRPTSPVRRKSKGKRATYVAV